MQLFNRSYRLYGLKYSLIAVALMSAWFIAMRAMGLSHITELRAVNLVFLGISVVLAIREMKRENPETFRYFHAFGLGLKIGAGAGILFSGLMLFYAGVIDPQFFELIQAKIGVSTFMTLVLTGLILFIETFISSMIFSLIAMQWFKRPMQEFHQPEQSNKKLEASDE